MGIFVELHYDNQQEVHPLELTYFSFDDFRYEDILELGLDSYPPGADESNLIEIKLWKTT